MVENFPTSKMRGFFRKRVPFSYACCDASLPYLTTKAGKGMQDGIAQAMPSCNENKLLPYGCAPFGTLLLIAGFARIRFSGSNNRAPRKPLRNAFCFRRGKRRLLPTLSGKNCPALPPKAPVAVPRDSPPSADRKGIRSRSAGTIHQANQPSLWFHSMGSPLLSFMHRPVP